MENWKIAAITAMVLAIPAYAALQNPGNAGTPEATSASGEAPAKKLDPALAALIGTEPKPWSFPASAWANVKKPPTPADLKGKVTLLEFWRTECSHCAEAVPFMNQVKQRMGSQVQLITFQSPGALDDPANPELSWPTVKKWMATRGVSYPVAFDAGRKIKDAYGIKFYPFMMLVGRDGKIAYAQTGHTPEKEAALVQEIQKLVAKPAKS